MISQADPGCRARRTRIWTGRPSRIDRVGRGQHADLELAADRQLAVPTDQPGRLSIACAPVSGTRFRSAPFGGIGLLARRKSRREFLERIRFHASLEARARSRRGARSPPAPVRTDRCCDRALGVGQRALEFTRFVIFARVIEEEIGRWTVVTRRRRGERRPSRRAARAAFAPYCAQSPCHTYAREIRVPASFPLIAGFTRPTSDPQPYQRRAPAAAVGGRLG